jgi:lysozyme
VTEVLSPLIARLKRSEGWRENLYLDTTGNLTIGYGHNLAHLFIGPPVRIAPVNGITEQIGELLLLSDVAAAMHVLETRLPWFEQLDAVRREVLVELVFNMGSQVLGFDVFLGQLKSRGWFAAASNMRGWKWYRDVHAARAEPLVRMIETGVRE